MSLFALSIMTYILLAVAAVVVLGCVIDRIVALARWIRRRRPRQLAQMARPPIQ